MSLIANKISIILIVFKSPKKHWRVQITLTEKVICQTNVTYSVPSLTMLRLLEHCREAKRNGSYNLQYLSLPLPHGPLTTGQIYRYELQINATVENIR